MKNFMLISTLLFFQCACTTSQTVPTSSSALLDFSDLAAEISVTHEITETTAAVSGELSTDSTD